MNELRRVTYEEQKEAGLIRQQRSAFVPPAPVERYPHLPAEHSATYTIDAVPVATQHIELRTSAVDRAKGFLIGWTPIFLLFSLAIVLAAVMFVELPLFSFAALVTLVLSFAGFWLIGWIVTLFTSAEGVSVIDALNRGAAIRNEQRDRWAYYNRILDHQIGPPPERTQQQPAQVDVTGFAALLGVSPAVALVLGVLVGAWCAAILVLFLTGGI
jgi:hypothetical protein